MRRICETRVCAPQVRLLYGPLLACVTASKSAFTAMVRQHGNGDIETFVRAARSNPEGREGQIYRCEPGRVILPGAFMFQH